MWNSETRHGGTLKLAIVKTSPESFAQIHAGAVTVVVVALREKLDSLGIRDTAAMANLQQWQTQPQRRIQY